MLTALAALHPAWGGKAALQDISPEEAGKRFYSALRSFGEALTQAAPVVLAIDDLHWADPALWECLRALALGFAHRCGLLLLAYRRPEIEQSPGWSYVREWDREGSLKIIALEPLSIQEVEEFAGGITDISPTELWAWTGGNPFFIKEWLAEPRARQPEKHSAISLRSQALTVVARGALESASILGEHVPYQMWMEVSGLASLVLTELAEELVTRHWLQPSPAGYTFNHDLIRTAIYDGIEPSRRRALHERAAHAYSTHDPDNLRARAFHLDLAGLVPDAARAYRLVGQQDLDRFAFREAQQSLERALSLLPTSATVERMETALALVRACEITGDQQRRRSLLEETVVSARYLEDGALLLQTLLALGKMERSLAEVEEAKSHFREALALARDARSQIHEIKAIHELGYLATEQGQWQEAQDYFIQAMQLREEILNKLHADVDAFADEERRNITSTLEHIERSIRTSLAFQIGTLPQEVQQHEEQLILYRRKGDRLNELTTQLWLLGAYYNLGAWDRLLTVAGEALTLAETLGDRAKAATAQHVLGLAFYALGDTANARPRLMQAERDYGAVGLPRNAGLSRNVLGLVAENEGNYDEALYHYRIALAGAEARQTGLEAAYARHDLGALLLALHKPLDAIPLLDAAREAWSAQGNRFLCEKSEAFLGLALLAGGERARAEKLASKGWKAFGDGIPDGEQPQGWLWSLYRLLMALEQRDRAQEVLHAAYAELQRQAKNISDPVLRQNFFDRVPLNRDIVRAHDGLAGVGRTISKLLVRKDVPLGRSLREADFVTVQWTLMAPEDESIPDKSARRRHRLRRLLGEAASQGATPTDDDLAQALGVSRRTILRDMQEIAKENPPPLTRKRKG
jgi:tetratricopeptide (TPR) repeat protein